MPLMWRDQLNVGNDIIDSDHKHLIEIINRIELCLEAKDRGHLTEVLDSLAKYAQVHFDREERIAKAAGYTQVPNLTHSHEALLSRFKEVRSEFDETGLQWKAEAADHFLGFLRNWLIDHVIKEDLLMKPALTKHSPSFLG